MLGVLVGPMALQAAGMCVSRTVGDGAMNLSTSDLA